MKYRKKPPNIEPPGLTRLIREMDADPIHRLWFPHLWIHRPILPHAPPKPSIGQHLRNAATAASVSLSKMRAAFSLFLLLASSTHGATFYAADLSRSAVTNAIGLASTGDTVILPVGTNEWSLPLDLTKAITIQGMGIGLTVIKDNVPDSGTWQQQTVFNVLLVSNQITRISGIEFRAGTRTTVADAGIIFLSGANTDGRRAIVDRCKFSGLWNRCCIFVYGALGVAYSNTFVMNGSQFAFDVRHENWGGKNNADGSWTNAANWGTENFWFIENNTMTQPGAIYECIDVYGGARWVIRYNTITKSRFAIHGTESAGRPRGGRAFELYNNTLTGDGVASEVVSQRSGSSLIFSNTVTGWNGAGASLKLQAFRATDTFDTWGGADGTNLWDLNFATNLYAGTATAGGTLTMTDSGAAWTINEWGGHVLRNLTTGKFSAISGNTATALTFRAKRFPPDMTFSAGHSYEINKVTLILDQPGVGAGDIMSVSAPAWLNQATEPCYEWGNTVNGNDLDYAAADYCIISGTHFFNDTVAPSYTPYTYPHPLADGSPPAPQPTVTFGRPFPFLGP